MVASQKNIPEKVEGVFQAHQAMIPVSNFPEQYFISMRPEFVRLRGAAQGEVGAVGSTSTSSSSSIAKNSSTHSSEIVSQQHTSFTGAPVVCQVQLSATDE